MASPPLEGDSTDATAGVTGTNNGQETAGLSPQNIRPGGNFVEYAGVLGNSLNGTGVYGAGQSGNGVVGVSGPTQPSLGQPGNGGSFWCTGTGGGAGVYAESWNGDGVQGTTGASNFSGVNGTHTVGGNGVSGTSASGNGVQGTTGNSNSSGVIGVNNGGGNGVYGTSVSGNAVAGKSQTGNAGWFDGGVYVNGTVTVTADIVLTGGNDCAEEFDVASPGGAEPGTVMVLGDDEALYPSSGPYDRRVAGVVSGAGDYKPALILGQRAPSGNRSPVALVGKVYCKVDATAEAIQVGDLLTSSATKGHAMKASDPSKAFGAVIGKALRPLPNGRGMIPILVTLQ